MRRRQSVYSLLNILFVLDSLWAFSQAFFSALSGIWGLSLGPSFKKEICIHISLASTYVAFLSVLALFISGF